MAEVKGKITVEISDDYLEAILLYTPNEEGKLWTPKSINDLLDEEGVCFGLDDKAIDKAYQGFKNKSIRKSEVIARGKKPELPQASKLELKEEPVPENIKAIMGSILSKAQRPEIYRVEKEVIKGPFKKEEIKEKRIPVKVNPQIEQHGYYRKDQEIGTLIEAFEGRPGTSVQGHNISQGAKGKQSPFLFGENLRKGPGNKIYTDQTGFLRVGKNWADIIPFKDHHLEVKLSKDHSNCILTVVPGLKDLPSPSIDLLHRLVEEKEYDRVYLLPDEQINGYISKCIRQNKTASFAISQDKDAVIELRIDPTETKAELHLAKGMGKGVKLDLNKVSASINGKNLKGVQTAILKEEITGFYFSPEMETTITLCEGVLPERGKDRSVNFLVNFQEESFLDELKEYLEEKPELSGPYASLKQFSIDQVAQVALVSKGDKIFSLGSASVGKPGKDVYGKEIPGIKGNDPELKLFEGIDYLEGSATAAEDGILEVMEDLDNQKLFARIRQHRDSAINVLISENQMQAYLDIDLPTGSGLYANEERIQDALDDAEVIKGILEEQIEEAAHRSQGGEVLADFLIAEGKFPMDEKTELRMLIDIDQQRKNSAPIKKGEKIGEILSRSAKDASGYTVLGEKLESNSKESIQLGDNIESREDKEKNLTSLYAEASGQLFFDGQQIFIKDTLTISGDINSTMGKVVFPGNVIVKGSVQSQVMVKAGEHIKVAEVVESALLSAEGNIEIGKGVKGNKKAAIHCQRALRLGYAEETSLMAVEGIEVQKALLHCNIKCNALLKTSPQGKIIGGLIKSKEGLETGTIGSDRGAPTLISFGQDYLVEDQIAQTERDIEKIQGQLLKIDSIIQKIQDNGGKNEVLLEAREKKRKALKMIEKKNLKIFLLREKFEMHYESSIVVRDRVFPGTVFESHGRKLELKETLKSVRVFFDQNTGKVSYSNL